jgi:hypothetical protein
MNQRIPDLVRPAIEDCFFQVNEQLPGLLQAFYLEGSIALGGFSEHFTDIDFVACLARQPGREEIDTLSSIHQVIAKRHARWPMQGSYVLLADLNCWEDKAGPFLTYHDGKLRPGGDFEPQSVEGWIVKNHGIAILGPEPRDLPFTVDWELLIARMRVNLNSYWAGWTKRPDRLVVLLSDWGIQWAVLGVLRQFYSFREGSITTKSKAGEYALGHVPDRWQRLIREALLIREGNSASAYRSRLARAIEAVRFLQFIIQDCNANMADGPHFKRAGSR